jgi:hypothetical protein
MSLLYKTIISFFPSEVYCTFAGEQWFLSNHELQLDVLRLCQAGYANLLCTGVDSRTFTMHISCLMRRYIDDKYCLNDQQYYYKFVEYLTSSINYGEYLLERSWFCKSPQHHVNVFLIELNGCSHLINVVSPDFKEHIESVMDTIVWCYEIYGKYTRVEILEGKCKTFFDRSIALNQIYGVDNFDYDYDDNEPGYFFNEEVDNYEDDNYEDDNYEDDNYEDDNYEDDNYEDDNYNFNEEVDNYEDEDEDDNAADYEDEDYNDEFVYDNEEVDNADEPHDVVAYLFDENGNQVAMDKAALQDFLQTNTEEVQVIQIHEATDADYADDDADDTDDADDDDYYGANIEVGQNDVFHDNTNVADEPERISNEQIQFYIQYYEMTHYTLLAHRQQVLLRMVANHLMPRDELDAIDKTILNSQTILDNWRAML